MKYLILFLMFINTNFSVGQECTLVSKDDGSELTFTSDLIAQTIGTFYKNNPIEEILPGVYKAYNITPTEIQPTRSVCTSKYFSMTFNEDTSELSFKLLDTFKNFDNDVANQDVEQDVEGCTFYLKFDAPECGFSYYRINLQYILNDYNLNDPKFSKDQYSLQATFPIPTKISVIKIAAISEEISATDIDFSTKNLAFEIVEEDAKKLFDLVPLASAHHQFPVDIRTKSLLYLQEPMNFTLKATDDGTVPALRSGETIVTISPTEDSDAPVPQFEKTYYQGNVDVQSVTLGGPINNEPIKVQGSYRALNIKCNGDGSANDYFQCNDELNVIVIKQPDEDLWKQGQVIVLTITATTTNENGASSENIVPFIITLENISDEPITTTTTEPSTTETSSSSSTETSSSSSSSTETSSSSSSSTETSSSSSSSTETTSDDIPPETTPEDDTCDEKDPDSDLITIIIILSIIILVLIISLTYGYIKYVRRQRTGDKTHLLQTNSDSDLNNNSDNDSEKSVQKISENDKDSIDSETYSRPLDVLPDKDEIPIQNEIDRMPKGLDRLIAEQEENNLLKPGEVKSRKRSMTFSESDDESRQYRENLSEPVTAEVINENKPDPVRKKSVVTFKL